MKDVRAAKEGVTKVAGVAGVGAMAEASRLGAAAKVTFGRADAVLVPASRELLPVIGAVGRNASALFDLTKFEIIRDFQQLISLFTSGQRLPPGFRRFWGALSGVFSICFSCWFAQNAAGLAVAVFIVETIVASVTVSLFWNLERRLQPKEETAGLEVITWAMVDPSKGFTVSVLTCDRKFAADPTQCYQGTHGFMTFLAVVCLGVFAVPMPFYFYRIIQANIPKPSMYDDDGKLREGGYTDANYREDLKKNISPFKSMFQAYERKAAYSKVIVMVMKVLLVLPATVLVVDNKVGNSVSAAGVTGLLVVQAVVTIAILGIYALWCWTIRPYLDNENDLLDGICRFTALTIAVIGLITGAVSSPGVIIAFDVISNTLAAVAGIAAGAMALSSIPAVRHKMKNFRQMIEFTKSGNDHLVLSDAFSFDRARKLRIWHEFWDVLFAQDEEYRVPMADPTSKEYAPKHLDFKYGSSPPYLMGFAGTVGERHGENCEIAKYESLQSYRDAIMSTINMHRQPSTLAADIAVIVKYLIGYDVFWDGSVEAKVSAVTQEMNRVQRPSSSATHFGRAYCIPFPFCVVLVMDDTDEEAIFSLASVVSGVRRNQNESIAQLQLLVQQNLSGEIRRRRQVRRMLRCLDGEQVNHFHQCWKRKTKERRVSDGKGGSRIETYTVNVLFTFRTGRFSVGQKSGADWTDPATGTTVNMANGFNPSVFYSDGYSYGRQLLTGVDEEGKHWNNETECLSGAQIGLTPDYRFDAGDPACRDLMRLMYNNWASCANVRSARLIEIEQQLERYRLARLQQFDAKEATMSYSFWYFCYHFDRISSFALFRILRECERNPILQRLPDKHSAGLMMVYQKLAFFDSHPINALWFSFWHDLWIWNQDVELVMKHKALLDPNSSDALCYTPMTRDQLHERLGQTNLLSVAKTFGIFKGYINTVLLDRLYSRIEALSGTQNEATTQSTAAGQSGAGGQVIISINSTKTPVARMEDSEIGLLNEMTIVDSYRDSQRCTAIDSDVNPIIANLTVVQVPIIFVPDPPPL
ncbi:hypothetical protein PBRA_009025 [Plasmodiophora brassicae]|uniref:Uncharacterized protein n=1 Tax=Plasmodiophora brassicae TaxID=37360 RepID=A0A0G4J568_PLABS|nr:hypothetical protein PBRA_009025 [Plasmodiophora brassicae]